MLRLPTASRTAQVISRRTKLLILSTQSVAFAVGLGVFQLIAGHFGRTDGMPAWAAALVGAVMPWPNYWLRRRRVEKYARKARSRNP